MEARGIVCNFSGFVALISHRQSCQKGWKLTATMIYKIGSLSA